MKLILLFFFLIPFLLHSQTGSIIIRASILVKEKQVKDIKTKLEIKSRTNGDYNISFDSLFVKQMPIESEFDFYFSRKGCKTKHGIVSTYGALENSHYIIDSNVSMQKGRSRDTIESNKVYYEPSIDNFTFEPIKTN